MSESLLLISLFSESRPNNVIGFLKILYGVPANEVPFSWSSNDETYEEPWKRGFGISSLGWNSQITEDAITPLSKEEILSVYTESSEDDTSGEA